MLSEKEKLLLEHIERQVSATGKYPSYAELSKLMGYKSKRSVFLLVGNLIEKGRLRKNADSKIRLVNAVNLSPSIQTVDVPLLGDVACGAPIFAEENIEAVFAISTQITKSDDRYFLLRANGDSMDKPHANYKAIHHGDLVLIRSQNHADDGDRVVAVINNEATIKILKKLEHHVVLLPHSTNEVHKPIVASDSLIIQGVVVDVLKGLGQLDLL